MIELSLALTAQPMAGPFALLGALMLIALVIAAGRVLEKYFRW